MNKNLRTIFTERKRFYCEPGTFEHPTYKYMVKEDGSEELEIVGKINTQEKIDSYRESTDLKVLLKRFGLGDYSALQSTRAIYGDFSELPTSLVGYLQLLRDAEASFMHLSPNIRERFDNDSNKFFTAFGTDDFYSALGLSNSGSVNEKEQEVSNVEQKSE